MSRALTRSATEPFPQLSGHSACEKLASGMRRMASLQSTSWRIVSLPMLPGSIQQTLSAVPSAAPTVTPPPSVIPATSIELTTAEKAALEAESVKLDRLAAEKEWAEYLSVGVVGHSDGLNLVRFWDVSHSDISFSCCLIIFVG